MSDIFTIAFFLGNATPISVGILTGHCYLVMRAYYKANEKSERIDKKQHVINLIFMAIVALIAVVSPYLVMLANLYVE